MIVEPSPPDALRINHRGELTHKDGEDVQAYLRKFRRKAGLKNDTPVCIITRETLETLYDQSALALHWGS